MNTRAKTSAAALPRVSAASKRRAQRATLPAGPDCCRDSNRHEAAAQYCVQGRYLDVLSLAWRENASAVQRVTPAERTRPTIRSLSLLGRSLLLGDTGVSAYDRPRSTAAFTSLAATHARTTRAMQGPEGTGLNCNQGSRRHK